ncbi:MAG: glycosyltransferase family 4 protein [Limisphaerales bacterium]
MKILAVYPYVPWPLNRGAYHRAFHLLKGLAVEHSVDLLALAENGEGADAQHVFTEFCDRVDVLPFKHPEWERLFPKRLLNPVPSNVAHWSIPAVQAKVSEILARDRDDAVHVLDLVLAQFFLKEHAEIPLVLDRTRVDLQYQLMEHKRFKSSLKNRLLNYENYTKLWAYEKRVAKRCALQVLCGPDDQDFVRKYISKSVPLSIIPNGVDLEYFHPNSAPDSRAEEPTVIFCGAMDYNPNVDALRWYFGEIHDSLRREIPDLRVLIVGKDPIPEVKAYAQKPGVTVTGGVPDVRPYYKRAWLQIVPLRIGGGTRLKIVESLGIRTPVVSTTIGAQGLDLKHQFDILYADSAQDFVTQTARALKDSTLRDTLGSNGRASAELRLSWKKLGIDLSQAYNTHIPQANRAASKAQFAEPQLA